MQVILAEGKAVLSRLIMSWTGHKVSHCGMRYSSPEQRWMVHAFLSGVTPDWYDQFCPRYANQFIFQAKFACADEALDTVVKNLGHKSYDYLSLVGFGIVLVLRKLGIDLKKNPLGQSNSFMCTEIVVAWLKECNRLNPALCFKEFDPELTDPGMLLDYLRMRVDQFDEIPFVTVAAA